MERQEDVEMRGELIVAEKDWLAVKGSAESLPMPFKHEVFLKECHVAGTLHVDDVLYKTKTVNVGTRLVLKRDVVNERDPLAIWVETQEGERVGILGPLDSAEVQRCLRQIDGCGQAPFCESVQQEPGRSLVEPEN